MKRTLCGAALLLSLVWSGLGQGLSALDRHTLEGQTFSGVESNLQVVLFTADDAYRRFIPTSARIQLGFISTDGAVYNVDLLRPEYGYSVSATGEDGQPVPRTRYGKRFGTRFGEVKGYDRSILATDAARFDHKRPWWTVAVPRVPPVVKLPAWDEAFDFSHPGRYTVTLQVQVFAWPSRGSLTNAYVVRFPPLHFDVVRPEGAAGGRPGGLPWVTILNTMGLVLCILAARWLYRRVRSRRGGRSRGHSHHAAPC